MEDDVYHFNGEYEQLIFLNPYYVHDVQAGLQSLILRYGYWKTDLPCFLSWFLSTLQDQIAFQIFENPGEIKNRQTSPVPENGLPDSRWLLLMHSV